MPDNEKKAKLNTSPEKAAEAAAKKRAVAQVKNYTGDEESERDYSPVRRSQEYKSGCLGGLMYLVFILCVSVVLACFAWMAASDALALNKDGVTATISLPTDIFETVTREVKDEDGKVTGYKDVPSADIDFVSAALKESGIIQYEWLFKLFCRFSHADEKLDPGTYELRSNLDYRAIVKKMQAGSGAAVTVDVMIPEGYTMHQIFQLLEEKGVSTYEELMYSAANSAFKYSFIDENMLGDASRLEGYLFPDTYQFYVGMQASSAINKLLQNFNTKLDADLMKQLNEAGYSLKDIVTIASLIEKEAAVDAETGVDERTMISSVIYNRLRADMTLGLESSILYIHQGYDGSPTAEMLTEDSPYNTNINHGLPPTPICNPSIAAIHAALNPADTNYYYFYFDKELGASRFFTYYNDFLAFVETQRSDENG